MTASLAPAWVTARATGIGAILAASLSMSLGLLAAMRLPSLKRHGIELRAGHEALAILTMALIAVHAIALLLDPVLNAGVTQILVPFASAYEPLGVALGQIAAYGMIALGLGYYVRTRIGTQRWRSAHRFTSVFWALGVAHGVMTGTDATTWWFWVAAGLPAAAGVGLLAMRLLSRERGGVSAPVRPRAVDVVDPVLVRERP